MPLKDTLDFFLDLKFNNNRTWFEENRARYEASQKAVETFLSDLFPRFAPVMDLGNVKPKDCMFRIFRDVRFSKDKSPYKTQAGAVIGPNGRKTIGAWYYLNIEPDEGSFIATGMYESTPEQLRAVRQDIAENPARLQAILDAPDFKRLTGGLEGERLKTPPKGYTADHPAIDLLKHKQFLASQRLTDAEITGKDAIPLIVAAALAMKPFRDYFEPYLLMV